MIYKWLKNKLFSFVSQRCLLCVGPTQNKHLLCSGCTKDLPENGAHCVICSSPFSFNQSHSRESLLVCGRCQKKPPHYTTSVIPHIYAAPLKQLITQLKFHQNLAYAPLLAQSFLDSIIHRKSKLPECIIPVPLHIQRLRERGFNQALELARLIAAQLNIPVDYSLCQRDKATPFQSGLSARQRKRNLKNAFSMTKTVPYKHVAIFDDVVTTGTTVNELAKKLKQSGVQIVEVWAIARTEPKK